MAKRWLDATTAVVALASLAVPMLVIALAVWFCLGRPLLFVQERLGRGGIPFRMFKFRTMMDTRDATGALLRDQERITRFGSFLRRYRLDELPELYNILRGDMSFVGPRPLPAALLKDYGLVIAERCRLWPGLTGWAQVNGNTLLSNKEKLALDLWYIDHGNLRLDFMILLRTTSVVILGEQRNFHAIQSATDYAKRFDWGS